MLPIMHHRFELAPASRRADWPKALAFAIATGAPAYVAIYLIGDHNLALTAIVGSICFLGTFIVGLAMSTGSSGHLALTGDSLLLQSGHLHACVPLAELDLAAARVGIPLETLSSPGLRLDTRTSHAVTIPRRHGPAVVVTPLDPAEFIRTLRLRLP